MAKKKIERLLETFGPQVLAAEEEEKRALTERRRGLLDEIASLEARAARDLPELEAQAEDLAREHETAVSVARTAGVKAWQADFEFRLARTQNTEAIEAARRSLQATAPEIPHAVWAIDLQIDRTRERFNQSLSREDDQGQQYYGASGVRKFARSNAGSIESRVAELLQAKQDLETLALSTADISPAMVQGIVRKLDLDADLLAKLAEAAA
jgi:hypothetical protein